MIIEEQTATTPDASNASVESGASDASETPVEYSPLAQEIASTLEEENITQIQTIVDVIGNERTTKFFEKAKETEANGGMMIFSGKRRRTPGGTFFFIVRKGIKYKERMKISDEWVPHKQKRKNSIRWEDGQAIAYKMLQHPKKGIVIRTKFTIIGRPKQIAKAKTYVVAVIDGKATPTSMPKGLPTPPKNKVSFAVFISNKQWKRVSESLNKYKDDELIVEGYPIFDSKKQVTAVLTQSVFSKKMQQAKREKQKRDAEAEKGQGEE